MGWSCGCVDGEKVREGQGGEEERPIEHRVLNPCRWFVWRENDSEVVGERGLRGSEEMISLDVLPCVDDVEFVGGVEEVVAVRSSERGSPSRAEWAAQCQYQSYGVGL